MAKPTLAEIQAAVAARNRAQGAPSTISDVKTQSVAVAVARAELVSGASAKPKTPTLEEIVRNVAERNKAQGAVSTIAEVKVVEAKPGGESFQKFMERVFEERRVEAEVVRQSVEIIDTYVAEGGAKTDGVLRETDVLVQAVRATVEPQQVVVPTQKAEVKTVGVDVGKMIQGAMTGGLTGGIPGMVLGMGAGALGYPATSPGGVALPPGVSLPGGVPIKPNAQQVAAAKVKYGVTRLTRTQWHTEFGYWPRTRRKSRRKTGTDAGQTKRLDKMEATLSAVVALAKGG